jgi:hypothetical protein
MLAAGQTCQRYEPVYPHGDPTMQRHGKPAFCGTFVLVLIRTIFLTRNVLEVGQLQVLSTQPLDSIIVWLLFPELPRAWSKNPIRTNGQRSLALSSPPVQLATGSRDIPLIVAVLVRDE